MSKSDVGPWLRFATRNLVGALPIARRYREIGRIPEEPRRPGGEELGIAISPTRETWPRYRESLARLGARSVRIRVPVWDPDPLFDLRDEFETLHRQGVRFSIALLQDRESAVSPPRFAAFAREAVRCFASLEPTIQVGHAPNRKKWGIWHPGEYDRLAAAVAGLREEAPACRFVGPAVIDFEYHFTIDLLFGRRPLEFDGIASLLYVDRRGSPDRRQYGRFDLREKIRLLRALVDVAGLPRAPIYLPEFNWTLTGAGKHSPAGPGVATGEAMQARYLVLYFLSAMSTGLVAESHWWQMVAEGYGLLADDWRERPSFGALRELIRRVEGVRLSRLPASLEPLAGYLLEGAGRTTLLLHSRRDRLTFSAPLPRGEVRDLAGAPVARAPFAVDDEPVWLDLPAVDRPELSELLSSRRAA